MIPALSARTSDAGDQPLLSSLFSVNDGLRLALIHVARPSRAYAIATLIVNAERMMTIVVLPEKPEMERV